MDERERALCARTVAALEDALASSNESWSFNLEVDRETVTLRGHVRDAATIALIEEIVRGVAGVEDVENRLVVGV